MPTGEANWTSEMDNHIDIDISDFIFGRLADDRRDEFEAAIDRDPALAQELAQLSTMVAELERAPAAAFAELPEAPALDVEAILNADLANTNGHAAAIEAVPLPPRRAPRSAKPARAKRSRTADAFDRWRAAQRPVLAGAVAVLIFVAGITLGSALDGGQDDTGLGAPTVQLSSVSDLDPDAAGSMWFDKQRSTMTFHLEGLSSLPRDEYYETWLSRAGGSRSKWVSLGSFRVDDAGRAEVVFPVAVDPAEYPEISITREPAGGDPAPSAVDVLAAELPAAVRRAISAVPGARSVRGGGDAARGSDPGKSESNRDSGNGTPGGNDGQPQQGGAPSNPSNGGQPNQGGGSTPEPEPPPANGQSPQQPVLPPLLPLPLPETGVKPVDDLVGGLGL